MGRVWGAVVGALFFVWMFGTRALDPGEIGWVMHGDWPVHFFGWHFFRHEPWHWPPGLITTYDAPVGTSIGFTDSIPLVAFALKPLSAWLPGTFQYLGPWLLACFTLQGWFGAWLMSRWSPRVDVQLCGATLFVLMPTLLIRIGHPALCAQWLLLWALVLAAREGVSRVRVAEWAAIGVIAGLMQPYLAAMVLALLTAVALTPAGLTRTARGTALAAALAATLVAWWSWGALSILSGDALGEGALARSMNLLGRVTPAGWSRSGPDFPGATSAQQFEGFQYLGLGVLLLLAAAGLTAAGSRTAPHTADRNPRWRGFGVPVFLAAVAMAVFALSPRVTLWADVLFDVSGPWTARLAMFRSSGRFFWPLGYLLLAWALAVLVRRLPSRVAIAVLLVTIVVQVLDLHGAHEERRRGARDPAFYEWASPMPSPLWHQVLLGYDHLVLYPPPQCGTSPVPYEAPAYLAGLHGLSINAGSLSRRDEGQRRQYCHDLTEQMKAGRIDDRSFYIVPPSEVEAIRSAAQPPPMCGAIDTLSVCVTATSYQRWRDLVALH